IEAAYRRDHWHSLLGNIGDVRDDEWAVRPAKWTVEVFGTDPELSIVDMVLHVGGAKLMYANHAFGDASMRWDTVPRPRSLARSDVMEWLETAHQTFADGVAALQDDSE